jgi:DeoR family transcriptional regulator of aga operon
LNALHVDKLFLGVDGFDLERGITTHFEPEALLNRKMVENAGSVIAITDRSQFGKVCLHRIIAVAELDTLINDKNAPAEIVTAVQQPGVEVQKAWLEGRQSQRETQLCVTGPPQHIATKVMHP